MSLKKKNDLKFHWADNEFSTGCKKMFEGKTNASTFVFDGDRTLQIGKDIKKDTIKK